ncbi:transposase [Streptomyces sp. NPDC059176]|uniref:transposase n=1 Tax=Streptomyces sp. NPDC059176 TaxID=3346758 RepID=UPI0036AB3F3E
MLVVDETDFAKRGSVSAGVARQYSGALGGVFPCQVGVMAAWATGAGQALIDVLMDRQPPPQERIRHGLQWSRWRRLHQAVARVCHRRRRRRQRVARHPPASTLRTTANPPIYG